MDIRNMDRPPYKHESVLIIDDKGVLIVGTWIPSKTSQEKKRGEYGNVLSCLGDKKAFYSTQIHYIEVVEFNLDYIGKRVIWCPKTQVYKTIDEKKEY